MKPKFKIGDKVRVIGDNHCLCGHTINEIGVIKSIDYSINDDITLRSICVEFGAPNSRYERSNCYYHYTELEFYLNALQRLKKRYDQIT